MKAQSLFVCLVFCAAKSAISLAADVDYTKDGPCTYKKLIYTPQIMPSSTGCRGKACLVKVTVTLPSTPEQSAGCPQGPYPIIVFFNAFQVITRISHVHVYAASVQSTCRPSTSRRHMCTLSPADDTLCCACNCLINSQAMHAD